MGSITIDEGRFPLVTVTFVGDVSNDEFKAYLERLDRLLARGEPNAMVMDARRSARSPAIQRKLQADWIKEREALLRRLSCGTAFVITSPLVRGVLTAILWLQPMPQPHTVVATPEEAEAWAIAKLRARGLTVTSPGDAAPPARRR